MAYLDQSCAVEVGSSLEENSYFSNDQTWLEVEAQLSDCGSRVELCDAEESSKRPDWSDDAVAGFARVDTTTKIASDATFSETSWRVNFAFSLRQGGFRTLTVVAGSDVNDLPVLGEKVYESFQALLVDVVPGFEQCFVADLAVKLEELNAVSAEAS